MENLKDTSYTSKKSEPYNQSSEQVAELAQSDFSEESAFCNQEEYGLWAGFCASVSPQLNAPDSNREMITPLSQEADEEYKQGYRRSFEKLSANYKQKMFVAPKNQSRSL